MEIRRDGPKCIVNTSLEMTQCFPFFRQRVTVPRFLVLCTLFLAVTEYEFEKEEVLDRRQEEKGDFFLGVVKEHERGIGLLLPQTPGGQEWFDRCWYPLPL